MRKSMIANGTEAEWSYLQSEYRRTFDAWSKFAQTLKDRYTNTGRYETAKERARETALYESQREASDACMTWLETFGAPRHWSSGVPAHWLYSSLTYADAMTYGQMSVTPPVAYGGTESQARAFAMPIPHSEHRHVIAGCEPCAIWNRVLGEPVRA